MEASSWQPFFHLQMSPINVLSWVNSSCCCCLFVLSQCSNIRFLLVQIIVPSHRCLGALLTEAPKGPGAHFLNVPETFQAQKGISKTLLCRVLFMSTGFAFKQSLYLCSISNLRIFWIFQLQAFKVGFSGLKTFLGLSRNRPQYPRNPGTWKLPTATWLVIRHQLVVQFALPMSPVVSVLPHQPMEIKNKEIIVPLNIERYLWF